MYPYGLILGLAAREGGTHFDHDIPENAGTGGIVELLFSGELSVEEGAEFLTMTVKNDSVAMAWLNGELRQTDGDVLSSVGLR